MTIDITLETEQQRQKRQFYAEAYSAGDINIGRTITGVYPNKPALHPSTLKDVTS